MMATTPPPSPLPAKKEVPTLEEFAPKFLEGFAKADRHKPSGVASKETILRIHLIPVRREQKLDAISNAQVQRFKLHLEDRGAKTVNNRPDCAERHAQDRSGVGDDRPASVFDPLAARNAS